MTAAARFVFGLLAIASSGGALRAQVCSKFDVASIKPNSSGAGGGYPQLASGNRRYTATNQLMIELMMSAYDVPPRQIVGIPGGFFDERYDVYATCEQPITKEQLPHLLQLLLAERFHLAIHRESKEETVYALVPGKGGAKLHETLHEGGPRLRQSGYTFTFTSADMSNLAGVLSQLTGRNVVDRTGLGGQYDFTLSYAPDRGGDGLPDSVFTALREQLGLNLEAQKGPVEFIVVDRLDRLIPN